MARKTRTPPANPPEPVPVWHAHIGRDQRGKLSFLDPQAGSHLQEIAVVDVGKPFRIHVPSSPGHGTYGLLIDGMTGTNAKPWSPSQVLAAARFGMFGFRIFNESGANVAPLPSPAAADSGHR